MDNYQKIAAAFFADNFLEDIITVPGKYKGEDVGVVMWLAEGNLHPLAIIPSEQELQHITITEDQQPLTEQTTDNDD